MNHLNVESATAEGGRVQVYRLSGVLGESSYSYEFGEQLRGSFKEGPTLVVLNLQNLEYITSAGVGVIASSFTSARRAEKNFVLACVPAKVRRVLDICGILDVVKAYDDEAEAIKGA
jgi:anti-sigma B factor antagonist